eukprot:scaffold9369_cov182-Amphora_coffeaeformis.AAC.6
MRSTMRSRECGKTHPVKVHGISRYGRIILLESEYYRYGKPHSVHIQIVAVSGHYIESSEAFHGEFYQTIFLYARQKCQIISRDYNNKKKINATTRRSKSITAPMVHAA